MNAFQGAFEALRNAVGDVDADRILTAVIAEARADQTTVQEGLDFLHSTTIPELRRAIQHHMDGKERWRDRAKTAEAELAARPSRAETIADVGDWLDEVGEKGAAYLVHTSDIPAGRSMKRVERGPDYGCIDETGSAS